MAILSLLTTLTLARPSGATCRLFVRAFPEYGVLPFVGAIITIARHTPRIAGVARYTPTGDREDVFCYIRASAVICIFNRMVGFVGAQHATPSRP